ncbi:hypothetical protein ASD51_31430 [Streptomyces sp. Root55]|uniref:DUF6461 domain-containing protein n=1 Tax=Streptomyces sp. Root55 TaxID=1736554 RepID=UPI0006FEDC0C|nr:DUF6461 domain-containing protein [Streptomyces sp. Root55]KQZ17694.1 hypothetical protein ASD51_31430 [Streptomyces sp. Root55]
MNLTELFGEGWCVTLAQGAVADVLGTMGAESVAEMPDGLERATERLVSSVGPGVLLLGREAASGWTMVVELEGATGWAGMDTAVLAALSEKELIAVTACEDPNQLTVQIARDGAVIGWVDAVTGRRFGDDLGGLGEALTGAGFPAGEADEPSGEAAALEPSELALLAMREVTGIELHEDAFEGSWLGGISTAGT